MSDDVREGARKDVEKINNELAKLPRVVIIVRHDAPTASQSDRLEMTYQQLAALYGGNG